MFRIRQSYREDVEQVLAIAEYLDTVNLPADRHHIEGILDRSQRSFVGDMPVPDREFLFVLEDLTSKPRIIGTSMIYAQHGTKRAPHIFFRVENDERYSVTLDRYFVHQTLRIGYNYNGPTEIGGLILHPDYRRNAEALGKSLSYVRFLFMRMHRELFRDHVLSELLPPLELDGTSALWNCLGRQFTGLTYQEADLLSKDNKEFIHALFPDDPIHTELLPEEVRRVIGHVGTDTKPVEKMLRRIGFDYAEQIDPFDGGPHFVARTDEITVVRDAKQVKTTGIEHADTERPWAIVAVEGTGKPGFRATGARVIPMEDGRVGLTDETRRRLGIEGDQDVWLSYG